MRSLILVLTIISAPLAAAEWRAGTARQAITPAGPMWMAGYAARNKPSEGKVHDLFAKALAVEDGDGRRCVVVTTDLIGIPRTLRDYVARECQRRFQLPSAALMLNASHTHCGPELRATKASLYGLPPERVEQSRQYYLGLRDQLVELVGRALQNLQPAGLSYTHGRAGFAMNRRRPTATGVLNRPYPDGPVDHAVPVLRVTDQDGKLRAILFGYACHNTTLGFYKFCGDYAGFAQQYLEEAYPGVTAMFVAGCGGDQNPQPRGTLALCQQHGRALANGVQSAMLSTGRPLHGSLRFALEPVELQFANVPSKRELQRSAESRNKYERRRAEMLLKEFAERGKLRSSYPYLAQVLRIGDELLMIALSGEVVVDYSLRLKLESIAPYTWVAGYSNDVFAYIPSVRVLQEGGYEGGGAMRYTTLPGTWSPTIEAKITSKVRALVARTAKPAGEKEQLFVAKPFTEKGTFTTGIEGPACDANGNLFVVNFAKQGTVGRVTPAGLAQVFVELPKGSVGNGIRFAKNGRFFIADYPQHNVLMVDPKTRKISVLAHEEKMNQPNDLAIAADGTLYASDPNWGKKTGQLWRIDPDGTTQRLASRMGTTNGIEVSPDGKTLYVNESAQRNVWAFQITEQKTLANKRLLRKFPDFGFDGMRCDVDGNLYITRHGKGTVVKLSSQGKILREISVLGKSPTNLCFGGPDGRTVYVTEVEHRRVVSFRVDRPGLSWKLNH